MVGLAVDGGGFLLYDGRIMPNTVLGSTGFIGYNLARALDNPLCPRRDELYSLRAGLGHVFYCIGDDSGAIEPNLGYLLWFLKNCTFESLTYVSSTRLYLGASTGDEEAPLVVSPSDPGYGFNVVKIAAEAACRLDPRCTVARLSTIVGLSDGSYLVPGLIRSAIKGAMNIRIAPHSERDFISIGDVIEMLPKLRTGRLRCYNLASGTNTTIAGFASAIQTATGASISWGNEHIAYPPISINRIQSEFDFVPRPILPLIPALCRQYAKLDYVAMRRTG